MTNSNNEKINHQIRKEQRSLAKNSLYSFLSNYSLYIYGLISSFLLARLISIELWGIYYLGMTYITIVTIILSYLPPGLRIATLYYVPKYKSLNQKHKLKDFIIKAFYVKFILVILSFFLTIFILLIFLNFFSASLDNHGMLLFILSPLIIFTGLNSYLNSVLHGLGLFKKFFIFQASKFLINIGGLLFFFLFYQTIQIEVFALINVIGMAFPFTANIIVIYNKLRKYKQIDDDRLSYKQLLKETIKYGSSFSAQVIAADSWREGQALAVAAFSSYEWITGLNIARRYSELSKLFSASLHNPLIISFTRLQSRDQKDQMIKIFKTVFKYSTFLILLITGLLFFITDFFLVVVYTEAALMFSMLVKLMLLSIIFSVMFNLYNVILRATDRRKFIPITIIITYSTTVCFFFIGLIYYGLIGSVIGLILSRAINFILFNYILRKYFGFKIDYTKSIIQYSSFFISLVTASLLGDLFLNSVDLMIFNSLNLGLFKDFHLLSLIIFVAIYFSINVLFRIFSKKDLEIIESFFSKDKRSHKMFRKWLKILNRFFK